MLLYFIWNGWRDISCNGGLASLGLVLCRLVGYGGGADCTGPTLNLPVIGKQQQLLESAVLCMLAAMLLKCKGSQEHPGPFEEALQALRKGGSRIEESRACSVVLKVNLETDEAIGMVECLLSKELSALVVLHNVNPAVVSHHNCIVCSESGVPALSNDLLEVDLDRQDRLECKEQSQQSMGHCNSVAHNLESFG